MTNFQKKSGYIPRFGLQGHLNVLFTALVLITGLALALIGYSMVAGATNSGIREKVDRITTIAKREIINTVRRPVQPILGTLAVGPLVRYATFEERSTYLPIFATFLSDYPILGGISLGYASGDFFFVRSLSTEAARALFDAPQGSAFMMGHVSRKGTVRSEQLFYDKDLALLSRRPDSLREDFDPRTRPWFQEAMRADGQIETPPFIIFGPMQPGMTFAEKTQDGSAVVAADILLPQLSTALQQELPSPESHLALLRPDGTLVASARGMTIKNEDRDGIRIRRPGDLAPILNLGMQAYKKGLRGRGVAINDGVRSWEVSLEEFDFDGKVRDVMLLAIPRDDLTANSRQFLWYAVMGMAGILLFCAPFIWITSRRISSPLRSLATQAESIHEFLNMHHENIHSRVMEIEAVAKSMRRIQGNVRNILAVTHALGSERDFNLLLELVLQETLALTKADGSLVALLDDEKHLVLTKTIACWGLDGEKTCLRGMDFDRKPDMALATMQALAQNAVVQTSITRDDPRSRISLLRPGFTDPAVLRVDAVCVPLRDRMGSPLGVLNLFKAIKPGGSGFQPAEVAFIEDFASTAAIALENNRLFKAQSDLRDALIHILAGAIDAKSSYTGGHCQRVPVIFRMLLEAACEAKQGPLKDFILDEDGWEETKLAGWLHDCGKVTTPEYVVDKATKLETIYDRIHEIRTRFEVLKRDAEIACLRAVVDGADPEAQKRKLEKAHRALDGDFAFVASCNTGSEFMDDGSVERLAAIGKRTWLRTLDKRLGVSHDERARMGSAPQPDPPVRERLLMDNPEHIIERGEKDILSNSEALGFKMSPPQALYNRGELYNLSIRRGTLTEEERYKIDDHITQTIIMLDALPLPKHLRNVPEIAGAHHETMDGRGHPRGLTREEMSWSARMLAIADIFEALTASDRPYKSSKTLREALDIMDGFKKRHHIDPDLYELFVKAGIPQQYAAEYLKPEQRDM